MLHGSFKRGFPCIEIEVVGTGETTTKVEVIVDTGFDGYLTLPYETAFPIGLTLDGIGSGTVADGNFSPFLTCIGKVIYGGKHVKTVIDVQPNCRPLLGNSLLKLLGLKIKVDPVKETIELEETR